MERINQVTNPLAILPRKPIGVDFCQSFGQASNWGPSHARSLAALRKSMKVDGIFDVEAPQPVLVGQYSCTRSVVDD